MVDHLSTHEIQQLFTSITNQRDRLLAQFLYESGCSVSEASELKASSIHRDGSIVLKDRVVRISTTLAHALTNQANQYVFHSRQTPTITPKRIQQILKPYISAVHKGKTTPHLLRYTHIIHAHTKGIPFQLIAQQTGLTTVRLGQILADLHSTANYNAFFEKEGGQ